MRRLLILTLASLIPVSAAAQTSGTSSASIDEVRKDARVHFGPLYLTPAVQLKELGMDSNVFNAAGDQKSDFTFTVAPKFDLWIPVARRALLTTTAAADLVWYSKYATERSVDPQATVRGELYFHRLTLFAEDAYLNTRQRQNFEVDVRARHLENNIDMGADYRLTPKLSVEVTGRRFDASYGKDARFDGTNLQQTLNRKTVGGQVVVRERLTPLTTVALRYENLNDRFEFSPSRDSHSYRVMPGIEFKPRALISGTAYVGYRKFIPEDGTVLPAFSGLVAQLGLSYTLLGATTLGVNYRRDLTYSYEVTQPFFVDDSVGAAVRRALGRRFDVIVSADRHKYAYRNLLLPLPLADATPVSRRVDTTWAYSGTVGYRLGRDARIGFGAWYWQRTSTTRGLRDYDSLRIGTTATYGF